MTHALTTLSFVVLISFASLSLADDGPVKASDLDARIDKAIVQALNSGVPLYKAGDVAGCYRLYQGALVGIAPLLAHRPEVQASVKAALASAESQGDDVRKAFVLREALDEVRFQVTVKSLWTRLGGEPAVKVVVHDFVVKAAGDSKVNFLRDGKSKLDAAGIAHLEELLVQLVSQVSGGPLKYTGRPMKPVHAGMGITAEEFNALASDLIDVLKTAKVGDKEINELVGLIATTKRDIVESVKPTDPGTLWARLGGEPTIKGVVHAFVDKAARDPKVDFSRGGRYELDPATVAHLEELLIQQISSVSGGPLKYSGRAMKAVHAGMKITEAQFNAIAADLVAVLKNYNVEQKAIDELMAIIATTKPDIVEIR